MNQIGIFIVSQMEKNRKIACDDSTAESAH